MLKVIPDEASIVAAFRTGQIQHAFIESGAPTWPGSWARPGAGGRGQALRGAGAGSNVAGPSILTANDWNVVGLDVPRRIGLLAEAPEPVAGQPDVAFWTGEEILDWYAKGAPR